MVNENSESGNTLYCTKCRKEIPNGFKFCTNCGTLIVKNRGLHIDGEQITSHDDIKICPECGYKLAPQSRFCTNCGKRISTLRVVSRCPHCGKDAKPGQRFCIECGESLVKASPTSEDISKALAIKRSKSENKEESNYENKLKQEVYKLESRFFNTFDEIIDSADTLLKGRSLKRNSLREDDCGYIVCDTCKTYYRLRPWDDPQEFLKKCECGGTLIFMEELR
ncbi:zinc ribbon domain-containing protein [Methanothermobacter sp. KEPCO 2]|uniref:zinc ribbon domain-containing protein n=1 Tax=Methanothermobacter sp. KEPCO 2 TaxID=3240977 RepID=UPI0035162D3C